MTLPGVPSEAPRAVTGHVDTLGAIVTQIKPNGRLTFDRIGGYPYFAVNGEYCWVRTADGRVHTGTALLVKSSVHVHREPVRDREWKIDEMEIRLDARRRQRRRRAAWASKWATSSPGTPARSSRIPATSSRGTWTTRPAWR